MTSRATSFGRHGLQNNPSGALMPGKVIGCGWTHALTVGGLGSEGDKTVIPGPKYWNPISSSKCIVLARQD